MGAGVVAHSAVSTARAVEYGARAILTGGLRSGVPSMADAYFPFRKLPWSDPRKISLNPRIIRRLGVGVGLLAGAKFIHDAVSPHLADPISYYDGSLHHMNDMGADSNYAQAVLGSNASVSQGGFLNPNMMARNGAMIADDAALMAARMMIR
mgnify:FL=1